MYKNILLLLSILFISSVYSANEYARATLKAIGTSGISGNASFAMSSGSLAISLNLAGATGTIDYTLAILNHGDLSKTPSLTDLYNPTNVAGTCDKSGLVQQITAADFNGGSLHTLSLSGTGSVVGLAFVIFLGNEACSPPPALMARDILSVNTIGAAVAWGIIGIGNINSTTVPSTAPFTALDVTIPSGAENPTIAATKYTASCSLVPTSVGTAGISGTVYFATSTDATSMTITAKVAGLTNGSVHGIHIHTYGDLSSGNGMSIGGHWKNATQVHALPNGANREYGDLGNICQYNSGNAYYQYTTGYFPIVGANNIIGRAIAIHATRDDGTTTSYGDRIAWCVIGSKPAADTAPFTPPASLVFVDPPVCAESPTPSPTPSPTQAGSGSIVQVSIFFIITTLLSLLF